MLTRTIGTPSTGPDCVRGLARISTAAYTKEGEPPRWEDASLDGGFNIVCPAQALIRVGRGPYIEPLGHCSSVAHKAVLLLSIQGDSKEFF